VAGIPTYVLMGELATNRVLVGDLPRPAYPERLASEAARRWRGDALASLAYAVGALGKRGDVAVALANGTRALFEAAHSVHAQAMQWALNEKGMVARAGLERYAQLLLEASRATTLVEAIATLRDHVAGLGTAGP
jgi:hypothetical protein